MARAHGLVPVRAARGALSDLERRLYLIRHGTTTMVASLVSEPIRALVNQLSALRELVEDGELAGVHLEGPFIAAARCGAHDPGRRR